MKYWRSSTQRLHKRFGLFVCLLIILGWIISTHWAVGLQGRIGVRLQHGCFALIDDPQLPTGWVLWGTKIFELGQRRLADVSWWFVRRQGPGWTWIAIPLWMPLLVILIPTIILYWRNRPFPPGHCRVCGYNLTGNVSGVCPECGEKI